MRVILKWIILMIVGGIIYFSMEMIFRGRSHWSMILVGGICFLAVGLINEVVPWEVPLVKQCIIGSMTITVVEFVSGVLINIILKWNVWDYHNMPLNLLGQICLPFSLLWVFIAGIAIILDDYLRYWFFNEEEPHYIF